MLRESIPHAARALAELVTSRALIECRPSELDSLAVDIADVVIAAAPVRYDVTTGGAEQGRALAEQIASRVLKSHVVISARANERELADAMVTLVARFERLTQREHDAIAAKLTKHEAGTAAYSLAFASQLQ